MILKCLPSPACLGMLGSFGFLSAPLHQAKPKAKDAASKKLSREILSSQTAIDLTSVQEVRPA